MNEQDVVGMLMKESYLDKVMFMYDGSLIRSRIVLCPYDSAILVDDNVGCGRLEDYQVESPEMVGKDAAETLLPLMLERYNEITVQVFDIRNIKPEHRWYNVSKHVWDRIQKMSSKLSE